MTTTETAVTDRTLLIVDDEPLMTDLFAQLIRKHGFKIVQANSGKDALEMVTKHEVEISLVVTDLSMPGMDGVELSRLLNNSAPGLPVLISTGFDSEFRTTASTPNVVGIINKPYKTKIVIETIRTILSTADVP